MAAKGKAAETSRRAAEARRIDRVLRAERKRRAHLEASGGTLPPLGKYDYDKPPPSAPPFVEAPPRVLRPIMPPKPSAREASRAREAHIRSAVARERTAARRNRAEEGARAYDEALAAKLAAAGPIETTPGSFLDGAEGERRVLCAWLRELGEAELAGRAEREEHYGAVSGKGAARPAAASPRAAPWRRKSDFQVCLLLNAPEVRARIELARGKLFACADGEVEARVEELRAAVAGLVHCEPSSRDAFVRWARSARRAG